MPNSTPLRSIDPKARSRIDPPHPHARPHRAMDSVLPLGEGAGARAAADASGTSGNRPRLLLEVRSTFNQRPPSMHAPHQSNLIYPTTHLQQVCVDTPQGLAAAVANGADRIELCSALSVGGLTPSRGLMQQAARLAAPFKTPVVAMVRPRAGDFVFTEKEVNVMVADIRAAWEAGLAGVVVGVSRPDGALDEGALAALVKEARDATRGIVRGKCCRECNQ